MTLIDTSAWIEFLRKKGRVEVKARVATLLERGEAAYCGPIEFELLSGARDHELADVRSALGLSRRVEFPAECWPQAAQIERHLRSRGVTVPRDDIFVAATALHHRLSLYTIDPHFALLREKSGQPLRLA